MPSKNTSGESLILISPWSRKTTDGKLSPKNYPHWPAVVEALAKAGYDVLQLSCKGEADVPLAARRDNLPLSEIALLMNECQTWASVDNFFHHMAWTVGEPGVVIFGSSDPEIFGHAENINLLKDRRFLREWQFRHWSQESIRPEIFVGPEAVVGAVQLSIQKRKLSRPNPSTTL
jgi:ADP-heptose:LPS heptosyltransferase